MNSNTNPPACEWQLKGEDRKERCNTRRQRCCEYSLTSNECRISNQRLIYEIFSWILRWNHFVDRKYVVYTTHSTIHEDDNKLQLRQLNVEDFSSHSGTEQKTR